MQTDFEYDLLSYPGLVFSKTNPERLATRAALHSIKASPPDKSRVLELGCGDGTNLLAQAYCFPESKFLGIDLSRAHIESADKAASGIGMTNVTFLQADVLALEEANLGFFDYIVSHGLYSWVPDDVREKVLHLYKSCLAENGVGFISFNAYPGCRYREALWDGLRYFTRDEADVNEKVKRSLMLARVIENSMNESEPYKPFYSMEVERLFEKAPPYILHDDLSPSLQPFYFYEFAADIEKNELQYVCEADPATSFTGNLNETGQKLVASLGTDIVAREQILDLINCRRFRNALVCRASVEVERSYPPDLIEKFFLAAETIPSEADADLFDNSNVKFSNREGFSVTTDEPLLKNALAILGNAWPRSLTFRQLESELRRIPRLQPYFDDHFPQLRESFQQINSVNLLTLSVFVPAIGDEMPEKPRSSGFARFQIEQRSPGVCSLDGSVHELDDPVMRILILLANGERNREDLISATALELGEQQGFEDVQADLPSRVDAALQYLWPEGFFLPDGDPRR